MTLNQETKGARLKRLRKEKGYTLEDMGNMLHIARQTYYKYENDIITNIPTDKIEAIARIFNVSEGVIMGWGENMTFHRSLDIESRFNDMIMELSVRNDAFKFGEQDLTPNQVEMIKGMLTNTLENIRLMVKLSK